jgi:hypothetical protein
MHFLEQNAFTEWHDPARGHAVFVPKIGPSSPLYESFAVIQGNNKGGTQRLTETLRTTPTSKDVTVKEMMQKQSSDSHLFEDIATAPLKDYNSEQQ